VSRYPAWVTPSAPNAGIIAIAKRIDPEARNGLQWCPWCKAQHEIDDPS
jgi:hypothetical protein